jgi:AICAR transformylase/IMP cyclohydrolase PurH
LINEFKVDGPTFAILKHNNACGLATRNSISEAYVAALPVTQHQRLAVYLQTLKLMFPPH